MIFFIFTTQIHFKNFFLVDFSLALFKKKQVTFQAFAQK